MFVIEKGSELNISVDIFKKYEMHSIAYFDIETTGFDKAEDIIMLISLGWFSKDGKFHIKQYYAEDVSEEKEVLIAFNEDIKLFDKWCSYNGKAFDEPFIINRMAKFSISANVPSSHVDLYRIIRPYYKQLGLSRCNLKTVEKYVGINRQDKIDGGISVELYHKYLDNKDEQIKEIIMLHNFEDVLNLPKIFKVVAEIDNCPDFVREDCITDKQLKYLKFLLAKNRINLDVVLEKISKKAASRIIDNVLNGNVNEEELLNIISNSY